MKNVHNTIDEARLGIMLNELRLPTIKSMGANNPIAGPAMYQGHGAARRDCIG